MRFSIATPIFEKFPTYCVGGVIATGLSNRVPPEVAQQIYDQLQSEAGQLRARLGAGADQTGGQPISGETSVAVWRSAFKQAGIKPGEYLSSVEALSRRALKAGEMLSINPAVDISNSLSLRYLVPLGGHDLDALVGDFEVRLARSGDFYSPVEGEDGQVESVPAGEPVYADQAEVRTRRWVWRQGRKARVTADSKNIFFPVDGWTGLNDAQVREAAAELAHRLELYLGANCIQFFLGKDNNGVEWNTTNNKDLTVPVTITNLKRERDAIDELLTRGVADIITRDELEARLRSGKQLRVKLGIDPTGPLIHIGRSVALQKLRDFQKLGHQIIMLFGTFTGQIGDASDKTSSRPMLTPAEVQQNVLTYKEQVSKILDPALVEWRFNTEWFNDMPFSEGIRLMSNFTVAQMIERDSFSQRFYAGKPISLQEIVYPVLQGYDSVVLKSDVEIGGTDQMFNMMAGRTMQRIYGQPEQSILMNIMINATDGNKMSTSQGNGVFITEAPRDQYAKMLRTIDQQIIQYFEALTRLPWPEVEQMQAAMEQGENPVNFKKRLAYSMVEQYHGTPAAEEAAASFEREHVRGELPEDIAEYCPPPGTTILDIRDLLVDAKLAGSKKEAARFVEQNGVSIDGQKVADPKGKVTLRDGMILKRGNRFYARVKLS